LINKYSKLLEETDYTEDLL